MTLYSFALLCFSFGVLLIAILVIVRQQDKTAKHFLFFSIVVAAWGLPHALWTSQNYDHEASLFLARAAHAFANFIPVVWLHFVLIFVGRREPFRCFLLLNYLIAACLTIVSPFPLFIKDMAPIMNFKYYTVPGPLFHLYTFSFFVLVPIGFFYLVSAWRQSTGEKRQQLKYLILATVVGFGCGSSMFPPTYGIPFWVELLAGMPLYPILMGIALIRHGLFEVDEFVDAVRSRRLAELGMLTASINHEVKNPLYVIRGLAESHLLSIKDSAALDAQTMAKSSEEFAEKVSRQAARASELLGKISRFIGRGSAEDRDVCACSVDEVVTDIFSLIGYRIKAEGVTFEKRIQIEADRISMNRSDLEEILLNLIINGVESVTEKAKLAPKGYQPRIIVSSLRKGRECHISIEDNGMGIGKENAKSLFYPFKTTKPDGTGLGLYITKRLCEKNGGAIFVSPGLAEGANFLLILPAFPAFASVEARPVVR